MGKKVEWIDIDFKGLIPALQAGRADIAVSAICITPERSKVPHQDAEGPGRPQGVGAGRHEVGQLPEGPLPGRAARGSRKEPGNVQPGADRPRRRRRDGQACRQAVRAKHHGPDGAERPGDHRGLRHRRAQEQA
ncbi:hypothetical protein G6F50_016870 [Rhizopus delemar]|uniref:Solute-binding protein family 3/N-terminal domain-containing protein n=1 Tax=Rhizopus delemar TaxID=936053 RepID=A0A9P6XRX2_9FUNG|nr:hypothetical protein G6F50_016870 [Rhizopus delemar]